LANQASVSEKEDFDKPTRGDGTRTPETPPSTAAATEVKEEGSSLFVKQPPEPTVVGNRLAMHYLKPTFSKSKQGTRLIAMHLSLALTKEHTADDLLPERIRTQWDLMGKEGRTKLELDGVPGQRVEFYMDKTMDDVKLVLEAAEVSNVQLAVIQKKGDGESITFIRLSFRLIVPVTPAVEKFAVTNYGNTWWVHLEETDEELFSDDEE
jgi:hypothetical protein